jgi:hypothetical protein
LPPDRGDDIVYRPLSGFALAAFVLAAIYSLIVVVGAIVAAFQKMPWLLGAWSALFPVTAILLGLVGWLQVHASEGTRTGKPLAVWAITLSIVVSLGYWAYYSATYFVVRRDAEAFCRLYFDRIRQGKLESAFIMTVPPRQRPPREDGLREAIEYRYNFESPQGKPGGGFFTIFKDHLLTHVIRQGGDRVDIEPLGVSWWEFAGGEAGYIVRERYRVTTPDLIWEGLITLKSTEGLSKEAKGRQWQIDLPQTSNEPTNLIATNDGVLMMRLQQHGASYLSEWQNHLRTKDQLEHVESYLATLEPAQRNPVSQAYTKALRSAAPVMIAGAANESWSGWATVCAATFAAEKYLPGYAAYGRGELVEIDDAFWPNDPAIRETALTGARQLFHTSSDDYPMGIVHLDPKRIAFWTRARARLQFRHLVQFKVRTMLQSIEAEILMECDPAVLAAQTAPASDIWRIASVRLMSLRTQPPPPPGQPVGLGQGPASAPGLGGPMQP